MRLLISLLIPTFLHSSRAGAGQLRPEGQMTLVLNISTAFPTAWENFFDTVPPGYFAGPVSCSTVAALQARCFTPPPGVSVLLTVPLNLYGYTVISLEVAISLT